MLLTGIRTDLGNHDGGCLRIGPDGKLYASVGDTGLGDQVAPGDSTNPYAQDLNSLNGKILRLNLDGSIPADNPFAGQAGKRGEIFAYGFRNPFRFGFDPVTGSLWAADVGDLTVEEIDIVTSGGNYAWPHCEGTLPTGCEQPGDIDPIFTYLHSGASSLGTCIIGGSFSGASFGALSNAYFFADCTSDQLYYAPLNGARNDIGTPALVIAHDTTNPVIDTPADVVFGPDGALYYIDVGGSVGRLGPVVSGGDQPVFGSKLTLKDNVANPEKKSLSFQSKDGIVLGGAGDDPTVAGGSLRVVGTGFDETYPLPAANWLPIGQPADQKGFKYKDGKRLAGPVKSAQVKTQKLIKASGKGSALDLALGATSPDPVTVELSIGARRYCATFGGEIKFTASKSFSAKLAPTPSSCP